MLSFTISDIGLGPKPLVFLTATILPSISLGVLFGIVFRVTSLLVGSNSDKGVIYAKLCLKDLRNTFSGHILMVYTGYTVKCVTKFYL